MNRALLQCIKLPPNFFHLGQQVEQQGAAIFRCGKALCRLREITKVNGADAAGGALEPMGSALPLRRRRQGIKAWQVLGATLPERLYQRPLQLPVAAGVPAKMFQIDCRPHHCPAE